MEEGGLLMKLNGEMMNELHFWIYKYGEEDEESQY